ncbi:unnamed protein product [Diabrotica balteata]|uniref:Mitoferrin-1 n=1 Tax=Diabrotica balteata TaxID=107213 RepID=A0A9N9XGF8_DIABA|nr:unnamed protein product [Diabrotica balteata]
MSQDDYETLHTDSFTIHLLACAMAGFMEFCIMFPIDTIKTRMQPLEFRGDTNILKYLRTMTKKEGTFSPLRGITPIAIAAGPAHGLYFANYELVKKNLTGLVNNPRYDFI